MPLVLQQKVGISGILKNDIEDLFISYKISVMLVKWVKKL